MGHIVLPVVLGLVVGSLGGLVGIGGGVALVPILLYIFHLNMHAAAGTSLSIVLPMSLVGAISHMQKGNVDVRLALLLGAGAIMGSWLGTQLGGLLPGDTLKKVFAFVLLAIALNTLADAYGIKFFGSRSSADPAAPPEVTAASAPLNPAEEPAPAPSDHRGEDRTEVKGS